MARAAALFRLISVCVLINRFATLYNIVEHEFVPNDMAVGVEARAAPRNGQAWWTRPMRYFYVLAAISFHCCIFTIVMNTLLATWLLDGER